MLEHTRGRANWDPIPVHEVDSPVASPLDHHRHVMSTEFPAYVPLRVWSCSTCLRLIDQNEFPGFSVTGRLPTWCHNFEKFEPQITAGYTDSARYKREPAKVLVLQEYETSHKGAFSILSVKSRVLWRSLLFKFLKNQLGVGFSTLQETRATCHVNLFFSSSHQYSLFGFGVLHFIKSARNQACFPKSRSFPLVLLSAPLIFSNVNSLSILTCTKSLTESRKCFSRCHN